MMNWKRTRYQQEEAEFDDVDITGLLDVVFILLIFFIIAASFNAQQGVEVRKQGEYVSPSEGATVIVNVSQDGTCSIAVGTCSIAANILSRPGLTQYLTQLRAQEPVIDVSIRVSPYVKTRFIVGAVDSVKKSGLAIPSLSLEQA